MSEADIPGAATHSVLINSEGQYSLWPLRKPVPGGWRATGQQGTQDECVQYVDEVWRDMRPLSLQKRMRQAAGDGAQRGKR